MPKAESTPSGTAPLLSICIPTYNRADILAQTLEHLAEVCGDDVEIALSDNCSPDHTQEVIQQFATRFRHLHAIRQAENRGAMRNFAAAIALASGEFIYTLSDDDEIHIDGLRTAISVLKQNEQIAAVYGGYQEWDRANGTLFPPQRFVDQRTDFKQGEQLAVFNRFALLWFPVCRRKVLQRFFTYDEKTFGMWELVGSLLEHGGISIIPELFYKHAHTEPRLEYELTKAWYHDAHRAQHEAFLGRIGPMDPRSASSLINARAAPAYVQGVRFAILKREFLTARHFMLRARLYGLIQEAEVAAWEKQALAGMVAERLLGHVDLASGTREVLFEDSPKLSGLREQFSLIAPRYSVGKLSLPEWQSEGLRGHCYLVTHQYGAAGWEKATELGPMRYRAAVDMVESCRITSQPLDF